MIVALGTLAVVFAVLAAGYLSRVDFVANAAGRHREWWGLAIILPLAIAPVGMDLDLSDDKAILIGCVIVPPLLLIHYLFGVHLDRDVPALAHVVLAGSIVLLSLHSRGAWISSVSLMSLPAFVYLFGPRERRSSGYAWMAGLAVLFLTLPAAFD